MDDGQYGSDVWGTVTSSWYCICGSMEWVTELVWRGCEHTGYYAMHGMR